ncbi:unnamed protein product [Lactuca saligna]|uniref:F-box associated beta-propeller type 3 domain-containing protein n=1 Tax=Lactuca saligna TaxID=75948 RepID=A0AA35Z5A4_LACSI|nr:unnamed protein product [Lactuca saligna]
MTNTSLWNPSIRRKLTLPDCPRRCSSVVEIGFGFDSITDDYKIVSISNPEYGGNAGTSFVYSIKTSSWCEIASPTPFIGDMMTSKACFVNGTLHWLFHDAQNEESDSSSDDPALERNEEETSEDLQPVTEKKCNYTHHQKRKNWVEREELGLAMAYVDVSKDKQCGNQQRFDAFWERVLDHFSVQMGGSDWSRHQLNSKWKDLQKKCNAFKGIYNCKMNSMASGRSEADALQSSLSEYRRTINQKASEDSPPPSSKRTKTSSSNAYTSSSDPQYPPGFSPQQQSFSVEDLPPQRKRK